MERKTDIPGGAGTTAAAATAGPPDGPSPDPVIDRDATLAVLAALGQATRLDVFRLLVRAGPEGMPAGDIARSLNLRQNTLSTHLAVLSRAHLVVGRREGRVIRFAADLATMRATVGFLLADCCGGHPERCRILLDQLDVAC